MYTLKSKKINISYYQVVALIDLKFLTIIFQIFTNEAAHLESHRENF